MKKYTILKEHMTLTFTPEAKAMLAELAQAQGISQSAVLEILIRQATKREKKGQQT
jgi:hypothetical protein